MDGRWATMNLFSLFKSSSLLINITVITGMVLYVLFSYELNLLYLFAGLLLLYLTVKDHRKLKIQDARHNEVNKLARNLAKGNLNYRITDYKSDALSEETINNLNTTADQIETFMLEVKTCFKFAQQHVYYRSPLTKGLNGLYSTT